MTKTIGAPPSTIQRYKTAWNKVERWCCERGLVCFDADIEHDLIKDLGLDRNVLSPGERDLLRRVRSLLSLSEHECLPPFSRRRPDEVPDQFRHVFGTYMAHLEQRGLALSTRRCMASILRKFLTGLGIKEFGALSMDDVTAHLEVCSSMTAQTRAGILYAIRTFTQWAADEGLCSPGVASAMPVVPGHKHAELPSAYAANEVAAVVAAMSEQCPKRDRAMLLLASVLGMRAGDLRALRLTNIDRRAHEVNFVQPKTGHLVRLPMPEEVMLALADYLRNERPPHAADHVFLHHRAPHDSFENAANAFHYVATKAYARAFVNTAGKHHGMHSLRHSAATNMLSGGTAYPVISGILGHSNANTTRQYMAIDVERLRPLSLEVPHA